MSLVKDMYVAANRHYVDGKFLQDASRFDNAGYHFGFSAECALKRALQTAGVRDDDISIWKHFPTFTNHALQALQTRRAGPIRVLLERKNFMQGWETNIRYSVAGAVTQQAAEKWRTDANAAIGLLI